MSGAHEQSRKRRPPKMYLISSDLKVQDQLDGTIRLQRGNICQEQDHAKGRGDHPWFKVLDNGIMLKIERKFLLEVPTELVGLLEAVTDPEARYKLLSNPGKLQTLATLPVGAPLWVQIGQTDELAEAELRFIGALTRGSSAVFFGVQLKGSAAGRGSSNGSFKGNRLFSCPEACALFVPVSHIRQRHWRSNGSDAHERPRERDQQHHQHHHPQQHHRISTGNNNQPSNGHHGNSDRLIHHQQQQHSRHISYLQHHPVSPSFGILPRTAESAPISAQNQPQLRGPPSPLPFHLGDRVCFPLEDTVERGEVRFCGFLPGRSSSGVYVGVQLDNPVGRWDGIYKGEKLCHFPSPHYGALLPVNNVSSEPKSLRHNPPSQIPKSILKPLTPPASKPGPTSPPAVKVALQPPPKQPLKPPPLPPPKPNLKPLPLPPLPPPKPQTPTSPAAVDQLQHTNGVLGPPSPLRSPDYIDDAAENGEAGMESELEVGSMVEVNDPPLFGVIRWIGRIGGILEPVAGIELDQELSAGTDGSYLGERHFRCPANKGLFVKLRNCRRDSRFPAPETPVNQVERCNSIAFAEWGSERVEEHTPPVDGDEAKQLYQGRKRGIQGHLNSCYLDATLFSLFSCCSSADWTLFWPSDPETDQRSSQAQDLLRCEIVNPLRRFGYVCASKTMALRRLLEAANSDTGFTNQEKDPEEFLNKLFQLLRVEPLLKIRSMTHQPQECHLYQLFPPSLPPSPSSPDLISPVDSSSIPLSPLPSSRMRVASVQTLLESSFLHAGLKFVEAPSSLLLLMPRFGKDFKMFDAILPTLSPQSQKRTSHSPVKIGIPDGPWSGPLHCARQQMSLFAVTCIETSHYVSFVKNGPLPTDWLFFDSMADREGGENGFNIPQVKPCPEVGRYLSLSEEELGRIDPASLRESARRLLCDSYMCLYHSPELSLYK
ncbi:LOW QUALITY PROTEIN: ubiquitin carboxyl-terminal hydrolase CYLD [Scomber japonicus]|uniref:LOW QUALITY PROTEIN: ubiquitin carboxyl-terminal hydrolase CYLD n=1 Tax=Scomber japonicus TaxID=13676 RepID=UPI002305A559|nr:LOW QUALITY PROTEIN: ubiquitin carboxyl-terminal hydrolase CYLD [Scomber japonicus]